MEDVKAEEEAEREGSRAAVTATKKLERIDKERKELMKRLAELKIETKKLQGGAGVAARRGARSSRDGDPERLQSRSSRDGGVHDELARRRRAERFLIDGRRAKVPEDDEEDQGPSSLWKSMDSTHRVLEKPTAKTKAKAKEPDKNVKGAKGQKFRPAERAEKKEAKASDMKRTMYESQLGRNGTLAPRPKAKYEANRIAEQSKCAHKFANLKWGCDKTSRYPSCEKRGLKSVVLYRKADDDDDGEEDKAKETVIAGADKDTEWSRGRTEVAQPTQEEDGSTWRGIPQ